MGLGGTDILVNSVGLQGCVWLGEMCKIHDGDEMLMLANWSLGFCLVTETMCIANSMIPIPLVPIVDTIFLARSYVWKIYIINDGG